MSKRHTVAVGAVGATLSIVLCMAILPQPGHPPPFQLPLVMAVAVVGGAIFVVVGWHARRHSRLATELVHRSRAVDLDGQLVYELDGLEAAVVAGLRHPRIFCASDLRTRLAPDELRAVLLHERFHQLDYAPAKLVVLQALAPLLHSFEAGRAWLARCRAALEIAADWHALANGASRPALASALLRLSGDAPGVGAGFTSAADLRLAALVEGRGPDVRSRPLWPVVLSAVVLLCAMVPLLI